MSIGCPKKYQPLSEIKNWAKKENKKIFIFNNALKAVKGADVIFSDKVISLNDKVNKKNKIKYFKKFKIDEKLVNKAKKDCIFLHCLPRGTRLAMKFFLERNLMYVQQAQNRVHVQKVFYYIVLIN